MDEQWFLDRIIALRQRMEACERGEVIMTDEEVIAAGEEIDRIAKEREDWLTDLRETFRGAAE